ncbi:MAG TPA: hypothetical protein VIF60_11630 [Burkholderiaceae bacterium]|jgi:phosphate starvation-inducible membrane PsiE
MNQAKTQSSKQKPESTSGEEKNSVVNLLGLLPTIGAAIALLGVVGSFAGFLVCKSYYAELGALWYVHNLPTVQFVQEGAPVLLFCALAAVFTVIHVSREVPRRVIRNWACVTWSIGVLLASLVFAPVFPADAIFLNTQVMFYYSCLAGILLMVSAGIMFGALIAQDTRNNLRLRFLVGMSVVSIVTFWLATYSCGKSHARFDSDPVLSQLSILHTDGPTDDWRVVDISGDTILALKMAPKVIVGDSPSRTLRLVKNDKNMDIVQSSKH